MKTDDGRPSGAQPPFDDEGLSRLHRAYSTETMPPEVDAAVLAAARRLARSRANPSDASVATGGETGASAHDDEGLSRLHRAYSVEKAPTAMNEAVLAAAARVANSSSGRASALWRFKLPVAMAAAVLMAIALWDVVDRFQGQKIEFAGTESDRRADEQLTEIRRLLDQGRGVEAAELLAGFRKDYPRRTVPQDIEKKLGGR